MGRPTVLLLSVCVAVGGNLKAFGAESSGPAKSLQQAALDGDVEQIKLHIAKGANFNAADAYGYTPLTRTIEGHRPEAAIAIIESGKANLNLKDRDGKTPLMVAAANAEPQIATALITKGADIKAKDNYDRTALHVAIQTGQQDIAILLIEKGADVNGADKTGMSPLMLARVRGQPELAELLKQKGATEPVSDRDSLYGDYGGAQAVGQGPAADVVPAREALEIDPNAIREELKAFEGLAAALKAVDDKSLSEQQAWIQRRMDNRTTLVTAVERQFSDEMVFVKGILAQESSPPPLGLKSLASAVFNPAGTGTKGEKTGKAIDDLTAERKKRFAEVSEELREQRRETLMSSRDSGAMGTGRATTRSARGRASNMGPINSPGYAPAGAYGPAGARTPPRPGPTPAEEPVLDPVTQEQVQAWLNAKPEDKKSLLETVHQMNLADLDDLRQVALAEEAKKTAAALSGLMLLREERIEKIAQKWQEEDERMLKLQDRYGPGGMAPGRGMQPGMQPQQNQPGMRPGRRGR